jgi:4-hydroxy-tetrahydrodipicolinate synthase
MSRRKIPYNLEGAGCLFPPLYTEDDKINVEETKRFVEWLIDQGVHTIVPGSTCQWLNEKERRTLWEATANAAKNRAAVMPYLGYHALNTAEFIKEIKMAEESGANSLYFSNHTVGLHNDTDFRHRLIASTRKWPKEYEDATYEFFKAGFEATDLPVMIYNHAGTFFFGVRELPNIPVDFMLKLANEFDNFSGIKTNSDIAGYRGNVLANELKALKSVGLPVAKGISELEYVIFLAMGGDGFVSPLGHAIPDKLNAMCNAVKAGDIKKALEIQESYLPLVEIGYGCYWGTKHYVMEALGFEAGKIRPPHIPPSKEVCRQIDDLFKKWGVYKKYTYHNW